ncbi:MAG: response regulator, partial [Clostridia bacterium]|nr:response regulator [Clostridia bacterium]
MFKKHGLIHSTNGKRMILVVDDEQINREILGFMLSEDYEVIYAENGRIALDIVRENKDTLSLVMTDILMPEMDGFELVQAIKGDDELKRLPIIVLTTEREFEIKSLRMGASDFIKKPYDFPEVVLARVRRIIELSEDRYIIEETETDDLTGLYNQEYFFKYAGQFDLHHRGQEMDAVVIDIEHFHFFNELYGREDGDRVLVKISDY